MAKATKAQMERDLRISRPPKKVKPKGPSKIAMAGSVTKEYAVTLSTILYILSALIGGAALLDIIEPSEQIKLLTASLLIAYAAVSFVQFTNRGVKHQLAEKQAGRE